MSRAVPAVFPVSRPTGVDYFLFFVGCGISLFLLHIGGPVPLPKADAPSWAVRFVFESLPTLLILPQGIILLWPLFYCTQRLMGRPQVLTAAEWLWGVAWIGTVLMTALTLWMRYGITAAFLDNLAYPPQSIWNTIVVPTIAAIAFVIGLIGLFGSWKKPWTHTFGVVLMMWPVLPLGALLLWSQPGWTWVP